MRGVIDVSDKIKCGDGPACAKCKFLKTMHDMGILPSFTKNALGRCDWYANIEKKQPQELDNN